MSSSASKSNKFKILLAILLTLFASWMYCVLHYGAWFQPLCFAAEGLLFLFIYGMELFQVPKGISLAALCVGCAALGCMHGFIGNTSPIDCFLPLTYLPLFLFLLDQNAMAAGAEASPLTARVLHLLQGVCSAALLCLIVYCIVKQQTSLFNSSQSAFYLFAFACIGVLYAMILCVPKKSKAKRKKAKNDKPALNAGFSFVSAVIVIAETVVFLLLTEQLLLAQTLPLLWIVNLLLLRSQEHPLVCEFFDGVYEKASVLFPA